MDDHIMSKYQTKTFIGYDTIMAMWTEKRLKKPSFTEYEEKRV